jgi:uncharacterized membrane protein YeiH
VIDILGAWQAYRPIAEELLDLPNVLRGLDFAGVGVFAITGALVAAKSRQDVVTCAFFAIFTGVGGGTVRDLLIGVEPFWIKQPSYLVVCLVAAILVFLLDTRHWPERVLTWLDALGLAIYCVVGTLKAQSLGVPALPAAAMGVVTACAGGIMRDIVAMRPSVLLNRELYVTAAIVGAALTVILPALGLSNWVAGSLAWITAFGVRAGSIVFGWRQREKG